MDRLFVAARSCPMVANRPFVRTERSVCGSEFRRPPRSLCKAAPGSGSRRAGYPLQREGGRQQNEADLSTRSCERENC
jgi:hypothetical protein